MFNIFLFDYILNDISEINILSKCMYEFLFVSVKGFSADPIRLGACGPGKNSL